MMAYVNTGFVPHIESMVYPSDNYSTALSASSLQFADRATQTIRYHCQKCDSRFTSKYFLHHHESSHNLKFICPFCPSMFSNKNDFKTHVTAHDDMKLLPCSFCNKIFYDFNAYEAHFKGHTEKPIISCHLCPAQFWQASAMRKHITSTHRKPKYVHVITEEAIITTPVLGHEDEHNIEEHNLPPSTISNEDSAKRCVSSDKRRFFKSRTMTNPSKTVSVTCRSKNLRKQVAFRTDEEILVSAATDSLRVFDFEENEEQIPNNTSHWHVSSSYSIRNVAENRKNTSLSENSAVNKRRSRLNCNKSKTTRKNTSQHLDPIATVTCTPRTTTVFSRFTKSKSNIVKKKTGNSSEDKSLTNVQDDPIDGSRVCFRSNNSNNAKIMSDSSVVKRFHNKYYSNSNFTMTTRSQMLEIKRSAVRNTRSSKLVTPKQSRESTAVKRVHGNPSALFKNKLQNQMVEKREKKHKGSTNRGFFSCSKCNVSFRSRLFLQSHEKIHTRTDGNFTCVGCKGKFIKLSGLSCHAKICKAKQ